MKLQTLQVDPEFLALIPPMREEEAHRLEESIAKDGFNSALGKILTWRGAIVEGHNRYKICQKYKSPFETHEMKFSSREEAINWIINNQLGRRNLTPEQYDYLRGKRYEMEKKEIPNPEGKNQFSEDGGKDCPQPTTAQKMAKESRVCARTIRNDAAFAKGIDTIAKNAGISPQDLLVGDLKIKRNEIKAAAVLPAEQQKQIVDLVKTNQAKSIQQATEMVMINMPPTPVTDDQAQDQTKPRSPPKKGAYPKVTRVPGRRLMAFGENFAILIPKSLVTIDGPLHLTSSYTVALTIEPPKEELLQETPECPYENKEYWTRARLIAACASRDGRIDVPLAAGTPMKRYYELLRTDDEKQKQQKEKLNERSAK